MWLLFFRQQLVPESVAQSSRADLPCVSFWVRSTVPQKETIQPLIMPLCSSLFQFLHIKDGSQGQQKLLSQCVWSVCVCDVFVCGMCVLHACVCVCTHVYDVFMCMCVVYVFVVHECMWCVHMYTEVCTEVLANACMDRGQRSLLHIFLNLSPHYF